MDAGLLMLISFGISANLKALNELLNYEGQLKTQNSYKTIYQA